MIREIHLRNFRNYQEEKVSFSSGINLFCGKNGHGKTNLLEAVYFLGMLTSFRKAETAQMIRNGEGQLSLKGFFSDDEAVTLSVKKDRGGWKKMSVDGGVYRKKSDYIGRVRMVAFSPDEMELIQGSPERRRRYIDRTSFNVCHSHLRRLNTYKRVLKHRNILLRGRSFSSKELDAWSEKLAHAGARIIRGRLELLNMLNKELGKSRPFLGADRVSLRYTGNYDIGEDQERIAARLLDRMTGMRREERLKRMTLVGPHRDDVEISVNGTPAKSFSSRGEMRSILLALKTAETEIYRAVWGRPPLILLDDVASELDFGRRVALLNYLRQSGRQVLITTTEPENIPLLETEKECVYMVERGRILN